MINVSKPFLPPMEEYTDYLSGIWKRNWLTNNGPLVNELELKLKQYLGTEHFLFLGNGTLALQIAIKAFDLKGEIITTPFSYVATTSSIVWEGCEPVFVDIDKNSLNIDPSLIEQAITERTSAIVATHVFGNPCDIDAIEKIAKKHNLKVIYDAAHGFGTKYKGRSIFEFGDISATSFHATKLYHTTEGGGVFTKDPETLKKLAYLRNFGHNGPADFACVGINAKNSEFHAAMGLCNLKYIDSILENRKTASLNYSQMLSHLNLAIPEINRHAEYNYSYYPVIFKSEAELLKAMQQLEAYNIFCRRYFYPSLSKLSYVKEQQTPVSDDISLRILCLPLYYDLAKEEIDMICRLLLRTMKY